MFACIITIVLSFFMGRRLQIKHIVQCLLLCACLYILYDILFASLAKQTGEQANEDNIRWLATMFFWEQSTQSVQTLLLGYGEPYIGSAYGRFSEYFTGVLKFHTSDVGFIGQTFKFGIIYVIASYILLIKLFLYKAKQVPMYIRMVVIYGTIMSPMIFPFVGISKAIWGILLYIADLHINRSPLANHSTNSKFKYAKKQISNHHSSL